MATYVLTNEENLSSIADAIRTANGDETATYTPSEMAPAILSLKIGSENAALIGESVDGISTLTNTKGVEIIPRTSAAAVTMADGSNVETTLGGAVTANGGELTGSLVGMTSPDNAIPQVRNIIVVDAGTDLSTLDVPVGTIVMERKA